MSRLNSVSSEAHIPTYSLLFTVKQHNSTKELQRATRGCESAQIRLPPELPAAEREWVFIMCMFVVVFLRAPHTVRSPSENNEEQLSQEEKDKR